MTVLLGSGGGALGAAPASPLTVGAAPGLACGDFNGDAAEDLVVANFEGNALSLLLGNGAGAFVPGPQPTIAVGVLPFALVVTDLDEDGRTDIAVANEGDDSVAVLLGNPP